MAHDILIVDDEADIRMLIAGILKDEGYATREAADTAQSLAAIQARQPTLVILDIWLQGGGLEGIEILKQLLLKPMSSLLANEFAEASGDLHRGALVEVALILLVMSLTFNIVARYLVVGKSNTLA